MRLVGDEVQALRMATRFGGDEAFRVAGHHSYEAWRLIKLHAGGYKLCTALMLQESKSMLVVIIHDLRSLTLSTSPQNQSCSLNLVPLTS